MSKQLTIPRNPMGYYCAPNQAGPNCVSEISFERFVAYGLLVCYADLDEPGFRDHQMVDDEHIRELREAFLNVVEGTLQYFWLGDFEVGRTDFDRALFGDATYVNVGNSDEGDTQEYLFAWAPFAISEDDFIFDLDCCVLVGEGNGGDPTTLFLNMEAVRDRRHVRGVIRRARELNCYPHRTTYQSEVNDELWEKVLKEVTS